MTTATAEVPECERLICMFIFCNFRASDPLVRTPGLPPAVFSTSISSHLNPGWSGGGRHFIMASLAAKRTAMEAMPFAFVRQYMISCSVKIRRTNRPSQRFTILAKRPMSTMSIPIEKNIKTVGGYSAFIYFKLLYIEYFCNNFYLLVLHF